MPNSALDVPARATLILPAYNAADFIERTVERIARFVGDRPDWHVVFVCDGCSDATLPRLTESLDAVFGSAGHPRVKFEAYTRNRGKGYAVRRGLDIATTPLKIFTDVDLAYDPDEAVKLADLLSHSDADMAVVNRASVESQFLISPRDFSNIYRRHVMSRTFNWWLRRMLPIRILDTQAGLKGMTAATWERLRDKVESDGFFFDVDLLTWAGALDLKIAEMPVVFRYVDPTTVRMVRHGSNMIVDTMKLRRRLKAARVHRKQMKTIEHARPAPLPQTPAPSITSQG